jgi:hypothetical protein
VTKEEATTVKSDASGAANSSDDLANGVAAAPAADLNDPRVVLALLEADQVVAAKRQSHFGRQKLSVATRAMLWGLRVYVVVMLVIVLFSVVQAVRPSR